MLMNIARNRLMAPCRSTGYQWLLPRLTGRGSESARSISLVIQPARRCGSGTRFFSHASPKKPSDGTSKVAEPSFWQRFLAHKPMPERNTTAWYREMALICTVFAITGSSTMVLVRPAVGDILGLQGSLRDGPWSYRICSLVIMTPLYATLLVMVGTVFGRHAYFRHFSVKLFSRFGIPPELLDPTFHATKKTFRKW